MQTSTTRKELEKDHSIPVYIEEKKKSFIPFTSKNFITITNWAELKKNNNNNKEHSSVDTLNPETKTKLKCAANHVNVRIYIIGIRRINFMVASWRALGSHTSYMQIPWTRMNICFLKKSNC